VRYFTNAAAMTTIPQLISIRAIQAVLRSCAGVDCLESQRGNSRKRDANEQAQLLARDCQLLVYRQRRKANIDPVEKGNDEKDKEKRDEPNTERTSNVVWRRLRNSQMTLVPTMATIGAPMPKPPQTVQTRAAITK
jgi:hypothetical protein